MEVAVADPDRMRAESPLVFRVRQGANRFALPGTGLCEFAFELARDAMVTVYVRCWFSDECGNTLECTVDGRGRAWIVGDKVFGRWLWQQAPRSFLLRPGLHRVTIGTCEDGLEFDRVVAFVVKADRVALDHRELDGLAISPPPVFETLPVASHLLPEIPAVTAQAFASGSLVFGKGHRNDLTVYARLNGAGPFDGQVSVSCAGAGPVDQRRLHLDATTRTVLMKFAVPRVTSRWYFVPVTVQVHGERLVHSQELLFVNPLSWAFLGPFPDPERKGLDLALPPDDLIAELPSLQPFAQAPWRIIEDGSCYDEFGVVDLNKVFGFSNTCWEENAEHGEPMVAYAVTCVVSGNSNHRPLAFGADDAVMAWVDGRPVLRQDCAAPLETGRQVVGLTFTGGRPLPGRGKAFPIVCKVSQRGFYWQLLCEPDGALPYGRPMHVGALPVDAWCP